MKGLRTRVQKKKVFLLSGFALNERKDLAKKIQQLDGVYLDSHIFRTNCTHLICSKLFRSEKFLGACATGKWILTADFIETSFVKKVWVCEDKFEWSPYHDRNDCVMSLLVAPKRWRLTVQTMKEFAFKGWKVAVLVNNYNRSSTFKRLLTSGGAELCNITVPVKNPENIANKVTYIFTEGKAAGTLFEQGLMDYGVLLLKPEFIAAHLLQISSDPMDYLATKDKDSPDDTSVTLSQDSQISSSQDSSQSKSFTWHTSVTKSQKAVSTVEQQETPKHSFNSHLSVVSSTPYRLSQSSMEDFFKTSRHHSVSVTPRSSVKKMSPEISQSEPSDSPISQFNPRVRLDFQQEPFSDVEFVAVNSKLNVLNSSQNEKPDEKLSKENISSECCSMKRKTSEDVTAVDKEVKKIKRNPEKLWKPTFVRWTHNQFTNKDSSPMEFPDSLASLIEICVDEKNYITALDMTSSMLTGTRYPQPRTIHTIITSILEHADSSHIAQKAFGVLMSIMNMHPPTTALMQGVYLSTFCSHQEDCIAGTAWNYISHVISNAVADVGSVDTYKNFQLLLQFFTSLCEWNFSNILLQNERGDLSGLSKSSLLSCMLVQVLWSPSYNISPNSRTRALLCHLQECLLLNVPLIDKQHVLELLLSLVSMAAQCCHLADGTLSSDIVEGDRRMAFVFELSRNLTASCVDDVETLQMILRHLQPSWLCLRVCQILLGSFDDYLLLDKLDGQQISLAKIVTQYFFLLPRMVLQKEQSTSQADSCTKPSSNDRTLRSFNKTSTQTVEANESETKSVRESRAKTKKLTGPSKLLVSKVNKRNSKGESAFHLACIRNDTQQLRQLLMVPGIDLNVQDNAGWTPLHEACNHGHLECVEMLLKFVPAKTVDSYFNKDKKSRKADLLVSTSDGITPLHDAVNNNKVDVCQMLLKYGGINLLKAKTKQGFYPVDLARTFEMKNLLSTALQMMFVGDSQLSQELVSSQDFVSSQDSQNSTGMNRTSYIPSDFLYEQVLGIEDGMVRACMKDCMKYVTLVTFLLNSYITTTSLLLKYNSRTPKKNSESVFKADSSQESSQNSLDLKQNCVEKNLNPLKPKLENNENGVSGMSRKSHRLKLKAAARAVEKQLANVEQETKEISREETVSRVQATEQIRGDVYHLRKMKHHLRHFENHLRRLTSTEEFKTLETKLACIKCYSLLYSLK